MSDSNSSVRPLFSHPLWHRARWEEERAIDWAIRQQEEMSPLPSRSAAMPPGAPPAADNGYHGDVPRPGDVLLLSRRHTGTEAGPLFVTIVTAWEGGLVLVCPFSRYDSPALDTELALPGREDSALAVLCLWNTYSVAPGDLQPCWLADRLDEEEQGAVHAVFWHAFDGRPVPSFLAGLVGTPMAPGDEMVMEYQREELGRVACLAAMALKQMKALEEDETEAPVAANVVSLEAWQEAETYAMAAAELPEFGVKRFAVAGQPLHVTAYLERENRRRYILVWDSPAGKVPAKALDGCRVFVRGKTAVALVEVGTIRAGYLELPVDAVELRIVTPAGPEITLTEAKP